MIKIMVCNETERDRKAIMQILRKGSINGEVFFGETLEQSMVTFMLENYTLIRLRCRDILYFEYINRKIRIVTRDREYICINEKISDIARMMGPYGFAMCHQSFVVNLYAIAEIGTQELIMKNGDTVYLAQKRASAIRKELRSQSGKILI